MGAGPILQGWLTEATIERAARRAGGVRLEWVGTGPEGCTMARMWADDGDAWAPARLLLELAREDVHDPMVKRVAIALRYGEPSDEGYAERVHEFVRSRVRFQREKVETFQSARYTLVLKFGDCDDHAKLVYALLRAGGVPARLAFLSKADEVGIERPAHTWAQALVGGRWTDFETTIDARPGEHPLVAVARLGLKERPDLEDGGTTTMGDARVGPRGPVTEGIDLAKFAGTVDWQRVAETKSFALIRAAYGTSVDASWGANWKGAGDAGVTRNAWQYFLANDSPVEQADVLVSAVGGTLADEDLPPAIDLETMSNAPSTQVVLAVKAWANRIRDRLGVEPMIYCSRGFYDQLPATDLDGALPLWVANWGVGAPTLPRGWDYWAFWQYQANTTTDGVEGVVDLDRFNGDASDLAAFAAGKTNLSGPFDVSTCTWSIVPQASVTPAVRARAVALLREGHPYGWFSEEWVGGVYYKFVSEEHPAEPSIPRPHPGITVWWCLGKAAPHLAGGGGSQASGSSAGGPTSSPGGSTPAPAAPAEGAPPDCES